MKDLISIFTYCPDDRRKKVLYALLEKLQPLRDKYEILVVSHSPIPDLCFSNVDYFYYDSKNTLLDDFSLTNKFWFIGESIKLTSSLVYPISTHLAIYRLIYFVLNFSKMMGFRKIHFIEYDIKLNNIDLINEVNNLLDSDDSIIFGDEIWNYGVYFATKLEKWTDEELIFDEEKILCEIAKTDTRQTESYTPKFLSGKSRSISKLELSKIDEEKIYSYIDEHQNDKLLWCVPTVHETTNEFCFFIFNEKGGYYEVDVFVDGNYFHFISEGKGMWSLNPIGDFMGINKVEVYIDKKLRNIIIIDESNRDKFRENNNFKYRDTE